MAVFRAQWLAVIGSALALSALIWWGIVFRQVVGAGYLGLGESLYCVAGESTICDLAMALCKTDHFLGIRWYSPYLLWLGIALFSASALIGFRNKSAS